MSFCIENWATYYRQHFKLLITFQTQYIFNLKKSIMTFIDSIKTCFSKYATFEGRATRSEYWWFWLAVFIACYIPVVGMLVSLATIIPIIAAGVRRLHDTNHCGLWILCPIYNIILLATAGDEGPNEYGEPVA